MIKLQFLKFENRLDRRKFKAAAEFVGDVYFLQYFPELLLRNENKRKVMFVRSSIAEEYSDFDEGALRMQTIR